MGGEILAVESVEVGKVDKVYRGEEVEDGDRDELEGVDTGEVPVLGDFFHGVSPVVGA